MSFRRLWAVTRKEIQHIFRDRATFILVLITPTITLFLMAYALTVDVKHVPIAVLDQDRGPASRTFIQAITAGEDVDLFSMVESVDEIDALLMRGSIKAAVIIHPDFERDLISATGFPIQIIIDGT